ncbi:lipopolysaccharide biosynthesis protein, partial [Ochrobactrum sp. CDB2]
LGLPETGQGTASTGRKLSGATLNHDHGSGIDIITPGQQVEGEWLSELIAQLRTDHKIILVDLPSVADDKRSVLLSRAADTALLVAQPDRNDQPANHALIQTMAALGRKPALAVVSQSTTSYRSWLESIIAFLRPNARQASQLFRAALKRRHQTASQSGHNQHEA